MHQGSSLQDQLLQLFLYLGTEWIMYLLMGLSIVSLAIAIERAIHLFRYADDLEALQDGLNKHLANGDVESGAKILSASRSHVAKISLKALEAKDRGVGTMEEIIRGATALERQRMQRGLAFLGTLGNNAPFIGLFGTVLGIIRAFRDLSSNSIEGSEAVMYGIAEALIATAVGLLVALPAVAVFNIFQRIIKNRLTQAEALSRIVMAHAKDTKA